MGLPVVFSIDFRGIIPYFSDIGQCCQPAQKNGLKNLACRGSTRIIYLTFSKYYRPLYKLM